jgi:uncharacterized protein (DUF849 family)
VVITPRILAVLLLAAGASCLACAATPAAASPDQVLQAYARALEEGRTEDAYALLAEEARREMPFESFTRMVRENPEEAKAIAAALARPAAPARVTAEVRTPDGQELLLVLEQGEWRVDGSAIDLYGQSTPESAVRTFLRAYDNKRWDILLRLAPESARVELTQEKLVESLEGEQKQAYEELVQSVRAALPHAKIERVGDRATLALGGGGTMQLVREHATWRIEEFH